MSIIYQDYIINVWRYNYCVELIIYILGVGKSSR